MDAEGRSARVPTAFVDALPERLWFYGNLYRVFGRDVHFCVADGGLRTVEVDGNEVGRGRPIGDVADAPTDARVILWVHSLDLGWIASGVVLAIVATLMLGGDWRAARSRGVPRNSRGARPRLLRRAGARSRRAH